MEVEPYNRKNWDRAGGDRHSLGTESAQPTFSLNGGHLNEDEVGLPWHHIFDKNCPMGSPPNGSSTKWKGEGTKFDTRGGRGVL